jgi:hypothetical protein
MDIRTVLQATTFALCGLTGYVLWQAGNHERLIASSAAISGTGDSRLSGLQVWAASKVSIGLGFPLDEGPESRARASRSYTSIEWDAWQAMRARLMGAHEVWVTVMRPPHASADLDDLGKREVDLLIDVKSRREDVTTVERGTVNMTVVPGTDEDREPYKLTSMTVEP